MFATNFQMVQQKFTYKLNMLSIIDLDEVYKYLLHYYFDFHVCLKIKITK